MSEDAYLAKNLRLKIISNLWKYRKNAAQSVNNLKTEMLGIKGPEVSMINEIIP